MPTPRAQRPAGAIMLFILFFYFTLRPGISPTQRNPLIKQKIKKNKKNLLTDYIWLPPFLLLLLLFSSFLPLDAVNLSGDSVFTRLWLCPSSAQEPALVELDGVSFKEVKGVLNTKDTKRGANYSNEFKRQSICSLALNYTS